METTETLTIPPVATPPKLVELNGGQYDNLYQLVAHGPRESGEIPAKDSIVDLIEAGWVSYHPNVEKAYAVTDLGIQGFLEAYGKVENPHHKIFGAIRVGYINVADVHNYEEKPLAVLGGAAEWVKANLLGNWLNVSEGFREYDYLTFDFTHPVTNVDTLLRPGDWVILREDHNHQVHSFI